MTIVFPLPPQAVAMARVPPHCRLDPEIPAATNDYFAHELATVTSYLDLVPETLDPASGDAAVGPIYPLPWFYVADLTGWRGSTLARLLASEYDCPCYQLSALASDSVSTLWSILDESSESPVVLHMELRADTGPVPATLQEALRRGYRRPSTDEQPAISGAPANVTVVFTDTAPSKRLDAPLPDATTPVTGAVLSYAPRRSMLPELPDGTTVLDDPPSIHERETQLEQFLDATLDDAGQPDERTQFVSDAVETLSITHSLIGKRDLLFDVSPRVVVKYGQLLDRLSAADAIERVQSDIVQQVPQTPGSEDLRATLRDLFPS